jgi:phosphohistidine phosphatase
VKRLLILRHAKSSWANSSISDWQRPLNDRGLRDAPRAGAWLRDHSLVPDVIVTSDAVRARTTAEAVANASGYERDLVVDPSLYHAKPEDVLEVLKGVQEDADTVLVVGHNPGLEDLVQQLTGVHHGLPTTALVYVTMPVNRWSEVDSATVASIVDTWQPRDQRD